jgi:hypothetical protein
MGSGKNPNFAAASSGMWYTNVENADENSQVMPERPLIPDSQAAKSRSGSDEIFFGLQFAWTSFDGIDPGDH